jgi:bacteriorhodopsin
MEQNKPKQIEMRAIERHSDTIYAVLAMILIAIVTLNIKRSFGSLRENMQKR